MKTSNKIHFRFRCGHYEVLTAKEAHKQKVEHGGTFRINGKTYAESEQYCLTCWRGIKRSGITAAS